MKEGNEGRLFLSYATSDVQAHDRAKTVAIYSLAAFAFLSGVAFEPVMPWGRAIYAIRDPNWSLPIWLTAFIGMITNGFAVIFVFEWRKRIKFAPLAIAWICVSTLIWLHIVGYFTER